MNPMRSLVSALVAPLLLAAGCAPDIEPPAAAPAVVIAENDSWPALSAAPADGAPRIPQPNDLLRDPVTGLLVVPRAAGASPAQLAYDDYLDTLDGFPPATPVTARFSAPLDPVSVTPATAESDGAVFLYDATARRPLVGDPRHDGKGDYELLLDGDGSTLRIRPHLGGGVGAGTQAGGPWRLGHTYAVLVFGGDDRHGVRGLDDGVEVIASRTTWYLRSPWPLLTTCPLSDPALAEPRCLCSDAGGSFDAGCTPAAGLTLEEAQQLEPRRRRMRQLLASLLPLAGSTKDADHVVLAWQFTVAHGPFAIFDPIGPSDPTRPRIPLPNDVLLDPRTGKVNLPSPDPVDPMSPLYAGLNQLDGFSTTGDASAPIEAADDTFNAPPAGVMARKSVLLVNLTAPSKQPDYGARPETINGGQDWDGLLLLHPNRPLRPDLDQYLAVVTTDVTDGKGRPLRSSPLMQLLKGEAPLVDADKRSTLPGVIDDALAQQLEALRLSWVAAGVWDTLRMPPLSIARERVALLWTFRTQSMTKALRDLAAWPADKMLPTAVSLLDAQDARGTLGPDVGQVVWGTLRTHLALGAGGTIDLSGGRDLDVPFLLTTPVGGAPAGVAIVQHGLGQWRGDVRAIAQSLGAVGWAAIAIDLHLHGARALCASDADCDHGTCGQATGVCSTRLAVKCTADDQCAMGGTCDTRAGACSTTLAPSSTLCMTHAEGGRQVTECRPAVGGARYLDLATPFASRDNLRQQVLDLAQLQRVLADDGPGSLKQQLAALPQPVTLPAGVTAFVGQSLGAVGGALSLATSPRPEVGVLNAPAGRLVDLLVSSDALRGPVGPLLRGLGITADSAEYYRLLDLYRWALDPGEPLNFARNLVAEPFGMNAPRRLIVQEGGKDGVIPNGFSEALAAEIGLPLPGGKPAQLGGSGGLVSTFFPKASHGFLFDGQPSTGPAQAQAATWIGSGGKKLTPPGP